ncbi:MAG: deoxyribonuclease IV [Bacilli bacterium]|nr:deoxyribonuclease IV [Bacilli bacterium]
MLLGCHVSFSGDGLLGSAKQAYLYGANTFMFYTGAPQNTMRKPLDDEYILQAQQFMKSHGFDIENVICHAPYIINLANQQDMEKWNFSIAFLRQEIDRCLQMGVKKIVVHPGSAVGITHAEGISHIIEAMNEVVLDKDILILFETMAGKGNECAGTLLEVKQLLDGVKETNKFGVCLDTCHLNDAGYDMTDFDSFLEEFDEIIGLDKIFCVHLNDSKNERGSHKDRHENIGFGTISFEALLAILYHEKLKHVPKILETPFVSKTKEDKKREYPPYRFEIEMLKQKKFNPLLLDQIRDFYKNA